jgi:hypothetical protein
LPAEDFQPAPAAPAETPAFEPPAAAPPTPDMPEPAAETPLTPPEPAAAPAQPPSEVEDLFKEPDETPPAAAPPATEPPAAAPPAAEPAAPAEKKDDLDDLFNEPETKKSASTDAAVQGSLASAINPEVEDLFAAPSDNVAKTEVEELPEPAKPITLSASESPMRSWTDNTGKYRVRARLAVVGDDYVRLLKETGKYTTVPLKRLSNTDLAYVRHQVSSVVAGKF